MTRPKLRQLKFLFQAIANLRLIASETVFKLTKHIKSIVFCSDVELNYCCCEPAKNSESFDFLLLGNLNSIF